MREGRFSSAASEIAQRYGESVSFDRRLYRHDIAGSIAHASALASAGILAADDRSQLNAPAAILLLVQKHFEASVQRL